MDSDNPPAFPDDTPNPWPEGSDYGKLWRQGYDAGRSDGANAVLPMLERYQRAMLIERAKEQSRVR